MVEVTSEDKNYPVESALAAEKVRGWRAADVGNQTIRLIFDQPQKLKRITLLFEETETERTQEFVLRWSGDGGSSFREIGWRFDGRRDGNGESARDGFRHQIENGTQFEGRVLLLNLVTSPSIKRRASEECSELISWKIVCVWEGGSAGWNQDWLTGGESTRLLEFASSRPDSILREQLCTDSESARWNNLEL